MSNTSLTDSYLNLSALNSALSKLVSEYATAQLQHLGANSLKNSSDIFHSSLSSMSNLASDFVITPELREALDSLISSIGSTHSQSLASAFSNVLLNLSSSSNAYPSNSEDYVTLSEPEIKEINIPNTIAIPIGNKRIRISTNLLIAIISGILLPIFFHLSTTITNLYQSAANAKNEQQRLEIEQEQNDLIRERNQLYKQCYDALQSLDTSHSSQSEAIESWKDSLPSLPPSESDLNSDSAQ